jgi:MFS transporter, PPP family, 3-phenylpropionic acid transporter
MDITPVRSTALPRFMLLYAAMYAAFGVASPFLPALVNARGLPAAQLGLVLSAGTAVRLLTAPLAGRLGDVIQGLRVVLVVCIVLAAAVTLGYLPAHGFWPFLALSLLHAAALAPVTILADVLALGAAAPPPGSGRRGFERIFTQAIFSYLIVNKKVKCYFRENPSGYKSLTLEKSTA